MAAQRSEERQTVHNINHSGYSSNDRVSAMQPTSGALKPTGLNTSASLLIQAVQESGELSLDALADLLSVNYAVPRAQALTDVAYFVRRGQEAGYLSFHATWPNGARTAVRFARDLAALPIYGWVRIPSIRRTYSPYSVRRVAQTTTETQLRLALLCSLLALSVAAFIQGAWSRPGAEFAAGLTLGTIFGFVAIGVLHETSHAIASSWLGSPPQAIYRQGLRVGLIRRRQSPIEDLIVAVVGPIVGLVSGIALLTTMVSIDHAAPTTLVRAAIVGVLVATSMQVACFVPPSADGTVIKNCLSRLRRLRSSRKIGIV